MSLFNLKISKNRYKKLILKTKGVCVCVPKKERERERERVKGGRNGK